MQTYLAKDKYFIQKKQLKKMYKLTAFQLLKIQNGTLIQRAPTNKSIASCRQQELVERAGGELEVIFITKTMDWGSRNKAFSLLLYVPCYHLVKTKYWPSILQSIPKKSRLPYDRTDRN